jgi:hypothetical protein
MQRDGPAFRIGGNGRRQGFRKGGFEMLHRLEAGPELRVHRSPGDRLIQPFRLDLRMLASCRPGTSAFVMPAISELPRETEMG